MNRLFVAYKPPFIGSNAFLHRLKKRYKVKKAGFSGTLDPFACGVLIIAFGSYTKLFRFLKKTPKTYRATLWLGAKSPTLDIEKITSIQTLPKFDEKKVQACLKSFQGTFRYTPPLFSAKKIGGKRAYELAHQGKSIELSQVTSTIYDIRLIAYRHPFVTFEAEVSEGTYIRSLGEAIAKALGVEGSLSYLERLKEGAFIYEGEKPLNPVDYLATTPNKTTLSPDKIAMGRKIPLSSLLLQDEGVYHLLFEEFFTIIEVKGGQVHYLLNRIPRSAS